MRLSKHGLITSVLDSVRNTERLRNRISRRLVDLIIGNFCQRAARQVLERGRFHYPALGTIILQRRTGKLWLKPSSAFFDKVGPLPRKDDEQDYLLHEGDHDKDEDKEDDDDDDDYDDKPKTATGT